MAKGELGISKTAPSRGPHLSRHRSETAAPLSPKASSDALVRVAVVAHVGSQLSLRILSGVRRFAAERGNWLLQIFEPNESHLATLRSRQVQGVIAQIWRQSLVPPLLAAGVPVVTVESVIGDVPGTAALREDDYAVGRIVAEYLLTRRLKHFAYVGMRGTRWSDERGEGFQQTVAAAGYACSVFDGHLYDPRPENVGDWIPDFDRMGRWLAGLPKPIGVMAANDVTGHHIADLCRVYGVTVPDEVSLVGVDNEEMICRLTDPPLTSVATPVERMGYEAAVMLDELLGGAPLPKKARVIPPIGIVERQSTELPATTDPDVASALDFIRRRAGAPIRVKDVVEHVSIGRRVLERRFKEVAGRTLLDEIRRVRVERAKQLLSETDLPLKLVAQRSGFLRAERMHAEFKTAVGKPPAAYRRAVRQL